MSKPPTDNLIPDYGEYAPDRPLYVRPRPDEDDEPPAEEAEEEPLEEPAPELESKPEPAPAPVPAPEWESIPADTRAIAVRARRRALDALGHTLRQYQGGMPELSEDDLSPLRSTLREPYIWPETRGALTLPAKPARPRPQLTVGEDGIITLHYTDVAPAPPTEPEPPEPEDEPEPEREPEPAADDAAQERPRPGRRTGHARGGSRADGPSLAERVLSPAVRLLALFQVRRQLKRSEAASWPDPLPQRRTPELEPKKAAKYYANQVRPLRRRCRVALALTLVLAWISLSLPMSGMLRSSLPLRAGVSLALMLAVMMTALDVVTAGLRQFSELRPGPEALATAGAVVSGVDGVLVLLGYGGELPFCAVCAAALTAALWGECLRCTALSRTYSTAAAARSPSALTCGAAETEDERKSLYRAARASLAGLVRRGESQELCRTAYAEAAPILLAAALVLSIWASIGNGLYFLHTLSALLSVCPCFAAFFCYPLAYVFASRRLREAGVAVAGYAGCAEIGRARRVLISDEDLFPPGTIKFAEINILEGVDPRAAVGCTTSLLRALDSGVTALFDELAARRDCPVPEADEFQVHEGGGLSAVIGGERVLVGTAGFMNLMGIRLPQNLKPKNAVCTAVSGELVAVFVLEYIPVTSVQQALLTLLRGRTRPIFAVRDFSITPVMLRQLFRLPADSIRFPSYLERCRMGAPAERRVRVDAVAARSGALPLAETAEAARKLYLTCRISTVLSLCGAAAGMLIMFLLCRAGSYDTATAGNVLSFMTLWSLPALILAVGQNR